jgi:hypothetical protein
MDSAQTEAEGFLESELIPEPKSLGAHDAASSSFSPTADADPGLIVFDPLYFWRLTSLDRVSQKRTLISLKAKRPIKKRKLSTEPSSPTVEEIGKASVEIDPFSEPIGPLHIPVEAHASPTFSASEQEAFVKELEVLLAELSYSPVDGQDLQSQHAVTDGAADVDVVASCERSLANDQLKSDQWYYGFSENLPLSGLPNQFSSCDNPQDTTDPQPAPVERESSSSPAMPSYRSSLLPQEMQRPPTPIQPEPAPEYEIVKDYRCGKNLPDSYLARIRVQVDPDFSNDNWGDEHYFSGPRIFKHIDDYKPDPYYRSDRHAVNEGLKRRATAIPERSLEDTWKSYREKLSRLGSERSRGEDSEVSVEEMQQHIQRGINANGRPALPPDLQPRVQQQKITVSQEAMQGTNLATLFGP